MELSFLITELQRLQRSMGADATVILFDKTAQRELKADPESETWDFDITRGDNQVVIEFD